MAAISKSESWKRITQAETSGDVSQVLTAIMDHVSNHPDESLFSVEKRLRSEGRLTHLFAETMEQRNREGRIPLGCFADIRTKAPCKYGIRVLMRSYPELWPVIAKLSANPQENLERLKKDTGIPLMDSQIALLFQSLFPPKRHP